MNANLLVEACQQLVDYRRRNQGNWQSEKADDYLRMIERALDEGPKEGPTSLCPGCGRFMPVDNMRRLLPHKQIDSNGPCTVLAKCPRCGVTGDADPNGKMLPHHIYGKLCGDNGTVGCGDVTWVGVRCGEPYQGKIVLCAECLDKVGVKD